MLVGRPAVYELKVRPLGEREIVGKGYGAPEWMGVLTVLDGKNPLGNPLFSSEPISGLTLSTAAIRSDVLPGKSCLWIEVGSYGWSAPHATTRTGMLFLASKDSLKLIWSQVLDRQETYDGITHHTRATFAVSRPGGMGRHRSIPTILVVEDESRGPEAENRKFPAPAIKSRQRRFVFDGARFTEAPKDSGPTEAHP